MKRGIAIIIAILAIALVVHVTRANGQELMLSQASNLATKHDSRLNVSPRFSIFGGAGYMEHDKDVTFLDPGWAAGAGATVRLSDHFALVAKTSFARAEADLKVLEPCESCQDEAAQHGADVLKMGIHGDVRLYLTEPSARARPYLYGGMGAVNFSSDAPMYDVGWKVAPSLGGGVLVPVTAGSPWSIMGDLQVAGVQCNFLERTLQSDEVTLTVGLDYSWGGEQRPRPPREEETRPTPAVPVKEECVPPRNLDSIMIQGVTYKKWGDVFTPASGERFNLLTHTIMGNPIYVRSGALSPYTSIYVELCPGEFQEFRTEQEVRGTTG